MNKKEVIEYLEKNKLDTQNAKAAFFITHFVYSAYADSSKVHGIKFSPVLCYMSYKNMHSFFQFLPKKQLDMVAKKMYVDFMKDQKSLQKRMQLHNDLAKDLDKVWKSYQKDKNILQTYKQLNSKGIKWWRYGVIGEDKGHVIDFTIVSNFEKRYGVSKQEARDIVHTLMHPEEQTAFNIERKLFLKICLDYLAKKDVRKQMKKYLKDFFWIKTDFYDAEEITSEKLIKQIQKEIKHSSKSKIKQEIKKIEDNFKSIHEEKKPLLKKLKLTNEDKKDIKFAYLITSWVDQRKVGMMKHFYYIFTILNDIAEKFGIDYKTLSLYGPDEVLDLLKTEKKLNQNLIEKRYDGLMNVYEEDKKTTSFFGKEGYELYKLATEVKEEEIKGMVASKTDLNKIKGEVQIVDNPIKDKFNKGKILVTSMTRVEFIPLMRKAEAIITNEGGISCHAAIVSRELKIPCVIGTKIATRILKNGDKVEMDMETGIVRKI